MYYIHFFAFVNTKMHDTAGYILTLQLAKVKEIDFTFATS